MTGAEPETGGTTRRTALEALGGAVGVVVGGALGAYRSDRSFADEDRDGLPDRHERSSSVEADLEAAFGRDQIEGLDPDRADLLLDARYVEGTTIGEETKAYIVGLFRDNGIHAQWLDYPRTYDRAAFQAEYGANARSVLWSRTGFYREHVEAWLRDVAVQLVVVPGIEFPDYGNLVYSPITDALGGGVDGHVNGLSLGNRAIVASRTDFFDEARLVLHELAHLGLCHDDDPDNAGVMGTADRIDLTDREWAKLRDALDGVRDTTGYDVLGRRCLWDESLAALSPADP